MLSQREFFLRHIAQTSDIPLGLEIERAEGCFIYDGSGKKYLDLISGISVSALGHGHPEIIKAIKNQAEKHLHLMVYGEYIQSPQNDLARLLVENLPDSLNSVYFTNSGAEATEGAMKLAKRFTGKTGFISFENAYHGSTQGALSLAGGEWLKSAYRPLLPDCVQLPYNDISSLERITNKIAAVFIDLVQVEAGVRRIDPGFLKALQEKCRQNGVLLVFDEIQTGMGRTGSLWAFEQYGVTPDILLLGKAFGGGMPLGAFITSKEMMQTLSFDPVLGHITTFGGHPVSCAAGYAALKTLINSGIKDTVREKESLFRKLLVSSKIKAFHSAGLLMALELESFDEVQRVIHGCIENGVITDWFLFNDKCIRIAPPLIIDDEEIIFACNVILNSIG